MKLLLDSCTVLWWLWEPAKLSARVQQAIVDGQNKLHVSVVTPWEVAIKRRIGRLPGLPPTADAHMLAAIQTQGIDVLQIQWTHALLAGDMPLHHRDPFDRMLIAQAQVEDLIIASPDPAFAPYGVKTVWT